MKDLISDLNADNSVMVPTDKTNGCMNIKLEDYKKEMIKKSKKDSYRN